MKAEERTWFPFIMTGLTVGVLGTYIALGGFNAEADTKSVQETEEVATVLAPTNREYQSDVLAVLNTYESNKDAGQSYEELLNVTVPAEYREVHLELVVGFSEMKAGKLEAGEARIDLLRSQVNWIP